MWIALRDAALDELLAHELPRDIVEAARSFHYRDAVSWVTESNLPMEDAPVGAVIKPTVEARRKLSQQELVDWTQAGRAMLNDAQPYSGTPSTVGETLAYILRWHLVELQVIQDQNRRGGGQPHPVASGQYLEPRTIADIALDLLEDCQVCEYAPGVELTKLIRLLLEGDRPKFASSREFEARKEAAWILAQQPDIGTRELARLVGVHASTISRWRKNEKFQTEVERAHFVIENSGPLFKKKEASETHTPMPPNRHAE